MTSPSPAPRWAAGDKAMVEVTGTSPDGLQVWLRGQGWSVYAKALHPLPPATAEDEAVLQALLDHVDRETCVHENTHRGGGIWTICDDCGRKWADDRGGFKPYSDPPAVANARAHLAAIRSRRARAQEGAQLKTEWASETGPSASPQEGESMRKYSLRVPQDSAWRPAPSPIDAAREAVCAAAQTRAAILRVNGADSMSDGLLLEAVDAYEALLTPPEPPDPQREANRLLSRMANTSLNQLDTHRAAELAAEWILAARSALAAVEART